MAEGGVEAVGFHLEFLDHVGVRGEGCVATFAVFRLPVHRPLVAANITGREVAGGTAADLALRQVLGSPGRLHAGHHASLDENVIGEHGKIHYLPGG